MMQQVVEPSEYLQLRLELLEKEKAHTRQRDELTKLRQALPALEITKPYKFQSVDASGNTKEVTLDDLFDGRPQLIIYHFMFEPDRDSGCPSCTLMGDHIPPLEHLKSHNTSFTAVSRAPIDKIEAYKKRLGFTFPWVSSYGTDFNFDFNVTANADVKPVQYNFLSEEELKDRKMLHFTKGEQPGTSVFVKGGLGIGEEGKVYHTYSTYARGGEAQIGTLLWLDMTPLGRQDGANGIGGLGYKRRDEYDDGDLHATDDVRFH